METKDLYRWTQENSVITNLLESLENKLKQSEKVESIYKYLESLKSVQSNCVLVLEIFNIVEDYHVVINQSIQAIRSLLYQNINLKEIMTYNNDITEKRHDLNDHEDYGNSNDFNLYERYLNTEEVKISQIEDPNKLNYDYSEYNSAENQLRSINDNETLKIHTIELTSENIEKDKEIRVPLREKLKLRAAAVTFPLNQNKYSESISKSTNDNIKESNISHLNEMNFIKITNEILKRIDTTKIYQIYFINKFKFNSFKEFLKNLIEYKIEYCTLEQILQEIIRFEEKPDNTVKLEESFSNFVKSIDSKKVSASRNVNNEDNKLTSKEKSKNSEKVSCVPTQETKSNYNYNSSNNNSIKKENNFNLYERKKSNKQSEEAKENPVSFEKLLRNYDADNKFNKKPFIRFTRLHGRYFDDKLGNKLSPTKNRSKSK